MGEAALSGRVAALQVLRGLKDGDKCGLVLMGEGEPTPFAQPVGDLQAVARFVQDLKPPTSKANLAEGMARGAAMLESSEAVDRELYVVSDRQALTRAHVDEAFVQRWKARRPPRLVMIPVGGEEASNIGIEAVETVNTPVIAEMPFEVEVRVHNHGTARRVGVPLTLWLCAGRARRSVW